MVKHIVTFKFKGTTEERLQVAQEFKAALMALPEQIEVGINENPAETWDLTLIAVVDKMEDVDVYAKHPAHVAAAAIIKDAKQDRACVDYNF